MRPDRGPIVLAWQNFLSISVYVLIEFIKAATITAETRCNLDTPARDRRNSWFFLISGSPDHFLMLIELL